MSLIHWWPLNGDTKDYGIGNITLTNSGATVDNSGKIGKCYSFNGNNSSLQYINGPIVNGIFSVAMWVKSNSASATQCLFCNRGSVTGAGPAIFIIEGKYLRFDTFDSSFSYPYPTDLNWHHITCVYSGSQRIIYIDGEYKNKKNTTSLGTTSNYFTIGGSGAASVASSNWLNGRLNDFRIYDHALSKKEIKEISKGLMLHYNFEDKEIESTVNLMPDSVRNYTSTQNQYWNSTRSIVTYEGLKCIKITNNATNGKNDGIIYNSAGTFLVDTLYTYSGLTWIPSGMSVMFRIRNSTSGGYYSSTSLTVEGNNNWQYFYKTFTSPGEVAAVIECQEQGDGSVSRTWYISELQLEQKNHPTPYVNGTREGKVYDNSGYNNNPTIYGTDGVQIASNSPSGKNYVHIPFTSTIRYLTNNFDRLDCLTYSVWFKHYGKGTDNQTWLFTNGRADATGFGYGVQIWSDTQIRCFWGNKSVVTINVSKEQWHLLTVSISGLTQTIYLDGVQKATGTAGSLPTYQNGTGLGLGCFYYNTTGVIYKSECDIADFKIYATALSASDVKAEYNRKASIDKQGNIYTSLFEQNTTNIALPTKTGIIKANHYVESGNKTSLQESYIELEYIESTGTQWINSNYIPNINTAIEGSFQHTENTVDTMLFGVRKSNSNNSYTFWVHPTEYTTSPKNTMIFNGFQYTFAYGYSKSTVEYFYYSKNTFQCNEQVYHPNPSSGSPNLPLIIFGLSNGGTIDSRKFIGKLFTFKIFDNGMTVRNFIPAKRKSDNTIGLYDIINKVFYTNQGTGTFTAGPEVNKLNVIYTNELKEI